MTEAITGQDLVEWQLRVAADGEPAAAGAIQLRIHGHAIEARICAENPTPSFLPPPASHGCWTAAVHVPASNARPVRVDAGVREGDAISRTTIR